MREEGLTLEGLRATFWVALSFAGVACGMTLMFLAARAVMDVGGFCAEGGPYEIRQRCPQGVPGIMLGGIWGGLIMTGIYVFQVLKRQIPSLIGLLWPALFLSLGWNFWEYGIDPPGPQGGLVWGWLICGLLFVVMGGLPLWFVVKPTVRSFLRDSPVDPKWRPTVIPDQARRAAERVKRATGTFVHDLEALERLHRSGVLTDEEFEAAKARLLNENEEDG